MLRHAIKALAYGLAGMAVMSIIVLVVYMNGRVDLDVWHKADLDEEFSARSRVSDLDGYLALEDRLFEQLDELVYQQTTQTRSDFINRYRRGSLSDPQSANIDWNRTFQLPAQDATASVLLLHGLSDSPYSMRSIAQQLNAAGVNALGLRIPGHGTAPSGLVEVTWKDMAAAVALAVRHLAKEAPDRPLFIVGYSNGAALAVNYALDSLEDESLADVSGLVLLSPEIGVTSLAALAVWQARLGHLLGLEKLAWNDILPEYDPYKYGSFAVNAGDLSYRITSQIQKKLTRLQASNALENMPPVLAFSSVVDATVLAPALISNLFNRLPPNGNELVLYDINAVENIESMLKWQPDALLAGLGQSVNPSFSLRLITNQHDNSFNVVERKLQQNQSVPVERFLGLSWPDDIYSLSHVALPFPPDDPVYGIVESDELPGIRLGNIALTGEKDVLRVSAANMLRLRWNPFFSYQQKRIQTFIEQHGSGSPE